MEFTLKLTQEEAQVVLNALVKEPYLEVVDVIGKIQLQASEQLSQETNNPFYAQEQEGSGKGI